MSYVIGMGEMDLIGLTEFLLNLGRETEWVEFKENHAAPETIGEYISALANGACLANKPWAYLLYGIEDETMKVKGTRFKPTTAKKGNELLQHWLISNLSPKPELKVFEYTYKGKNLSMLMIGAAYDQPIRFKGEGHIRISSIKRKIKDFPNLERKIWAKSRRFAFEREIAKTDVNISDLRKYLKVDKLFDLIGDSCPTDIFQAVDELVRRNYIRRIGDGPTCDITNLGAILLACDLELFENMARNAIRVIVYEGKDRLHTKIEQEGRYGYAYKFDGLVKWINDQLPSNEVITAAIRKNVKMYPEIAVRELVANALIHQDFLETGTYVKVEIFSDRVEISNPGSPLIDPLRLIDDFPRSRNEELAKQMRDFGICEERGSGIDKVVTYCEYFQLPAPKFLSSGNHMVAILYSYKDLAEMEKEDRIRACYQHCVLKFLSNEHMTNTSLRDRFKIAASNYPMASKIIKDTLETKLIKPGDPNSNSRRHAKYIPFWAPDPHFH
jgi:predicted HTH transcriptional regulator